MNGLSTYTHEIGHIPLLSAEEEVDLVERMRNGDQAARIKLIESNLRLVISVAKKYCIETIPFEDLIQEGNIGLMRAADVFDPTRTKRFSTCAVWYIKQAIIRYIETKSDVIRVPTNIGEEIRKLKRAENELVGILGRVPTEDEVAEFLGLSDVQMRKYREAAKKIESLDTPVTEDGATLGEIIPDDNSIGTPEASAMETAKRETLDMVLDTLGQRERDILRCKYGLDDGHGKTLEEVGKIFNLSGERVRQIEAVALRKLRQPFRANILREAFG